MNFLAVIISFKGGVRPNHNSQHDLLRFTLIVAIAPGTSTSFVMQLLSYPETTSKSDELYTTGSAIDKCCDCR